MTTDEDKTVQHESAKSPKGITVETVSKIREFASTHSDSDGGVDNLRNALEQQLCEIISFCRLEIPGKTHPNCWGDVGSDVVLNVEECLSVRIEMTVGEAKGRFKRGACQEKVEKCILDMLENAATHKTEECIAE